MAKIDLTALYRQGLAHQQAGRLDEALALYNQILAAQPGIPEVLFQRARCVSGSDPKAAEADFRKALKGKPKEPAIWQGLHGVLRGPARAKLEKDAHRAGIPIGSEAELRPILAAIAKGRAVQAEQAALKLTRLAPAAFWPAYALGEARLAQSKPAVAILEAAHARAPGHAKARLALARAYAAAARPATAEEVLRAGGDLTADAALILARIYRDTARSEEAVALLETYRGTDKRVLADLAVSLAQTGRGGEALEIIGRMSLPPASVFRSCAIAAEEAGDFTGAEALIDAALVTPQVGLLTHRAQLRQSAGDFAQADADLMAEIDASPTFGESFRAYVNGRKIMAGDPILPRLDAALDRADPSGLDRAALQFAAAKASADLGEHALVFAHLHTANRKMAQAFPYGFESDLQEARALKADWRILRDIPADGPTDPIAFVTGLPRSGTTLVETILAAHPRVSAGGEMPFLSRALSPVIEALRHGAPDGDLLAEAGSRYLTAARRRVGDAPVIVDKAISTFSRIGHAARALPGARFLLVRRDPRDVGLSLYRNMFPHGLHRYAYDLADMGRYIRLHDAITTFWQATLPDRIHVVDYEDLTKDPEPTIRTMLEAMDLPFDEACLVPERSGRRIQTLSFAQARQPIGTGAIAGWQRYEGDLKPLIEALDTEIDLEATP